MLFRWTLCMLLFALCNIPALAVTPSVTDVQAKQTQDYARKVKITYTLNGPDSSFVYVTVNISDQEGTTYTITPSLAIGDIGWVRPGGTRTIYWNAKNQYPNKDWSSCSAKINIDESSDKVRPGEMIFITAGRFLMGNNGNEPFSYEEELPQHSVYLPGYYIGKYEVTRGEYKQFMEAGGYSNRAYWSAEGWKWKTGTNRTQPDYWSPQQNWECTTFTQTDNYPVVGATYYEAEAFCKWAGGKLPTQAQWEKAARWNGKHPNVYPWGDTWDAEKCNNYNDNNPAGGGYQQNQTAPVGSYPAGASPYGCQDMAGNVWEWCKDWYHNRYFTQTPKGGWVDPQGPSTGVTRVLQGGGWGGYDGYYRCAFRYYYDPSSSWNMSGFRLAR